MTLTKSEIARALATEVPGSSVLRRRPGGTLLAEFNPVKLAHAIETEVVRAEANGLTKLRLTIDLPEAMDLARFLRMRLR